MISHLNYNNMRPGVAREASHKIDFKEKSFLETKMIIKSTQQFHTYQQNPGIHETKR